jgi:hypothetical protein
MHLKTVAEDSLVPFQHPHLALLGQGYIVANRGLRTTGGRRSGEQEQPCQR